MNDFEVFTKVGVEICKKYRIPLMYAFGSQVTGNTSVLSDYDVAILLSRDDVRQTKLMFRSELAFAFQQKGYTPVDILILNTSPPVITYEVISKGQTIYCNDEELRVDFETKALSVYFDFKIFNDKFNDEYLRSFLVENT